MTISFIILALLVLAGAALAMSLRNLVHCALCLVLSFTGLAGLFLQLQAQFVGFAQILVYGGAVSILVVFAILLTRSGDTQESAEINRDWVIGCWIAAIVFSTLAMALLSSAFFKEPQAVPGQADASAMGHELMTRYVLPLEAVALLLTAALIGAALIAMPELRKPQGHAPDKEVA